VTKKDEELVKLQRALKAKEQDISTMKVNEIFVYELSLFTVFNHFKFSQQNTISHFKLRLDMADKQVADNTTGATLNAQIKQLQIKCDQLQEELQHEKRWRSLFPNPINNTLKIKVLIVKINYSSSDSEQRLADLKAQVATLEMELKKEQARTRQFSTKALIAVISLNVKRNIFGESGVAYLPNFVISKFPAVLGNKAN
jgi:outer membrane murein-binding lipoprotein Lpp